MKKLNLLLLLLVVLVLAFVPAVKLMRFEVINKSGQEAVVILDEVNFDQPYYFYLSIPAGGVLPEVRMFTIPQGLYHPQVIACGQLQATQFKNLNLFKGYFRFVILPCELREAKDGDGVLKYNPLVYPFEDVFGVPIIHDLGGGFRWRY
jgi:hypothetical protein